MSINAMALATALFVPSSALAQSSVQDWHMLDGSNLSTVFVQDDSGQETRGRVVSLNTDSLVLLVEDEERRFEATRVRRLAKQGDSLRNGALIGALVGGILGAAGTPECSGTLLDAVAPCGTRGRVGVGLVAAAAFAGIGVGIDALIQGRTTLYEAPTSDPVAFASAQPSGQSAARPSVSGLRLHFRW